MYKHNGINDKYISLHDCHAKNVLYENGVLTFFFPDGIWIANEHSHNPTDKTIKSDSAEVKFYLEFKNKSDITVYVFEEKFKRTIRKEWKLSKLIEYINNKDYSLEFLYSYKGYHSMIIECWLWSNKKPYHRECELKLMFEDVKYCWNHLCINREW